MNIQHRSEKNESAWFPKYARITSNASRDSTEAGTNAMETVYRISNYFMGNKKGWITIDFASTYTIRNQML